MSVTSMSSGEEKNKGADTFTAVAPTITPENGVTQEKMGSNSYETDEHQHLAEKDLDAAAAIATGVKLTPEQSKRILRKIDWHIMPPMMCLYMVQFLDKTTLGNSVLLGVKTANKLTTSEYNLLSTAFYISYLVFVWPQNLCLQRFPVGKWMGGNIMVWAMFLMCHAACHNFAGLFVVRLGLGVAEGSITAGFLIITSMFYTKTEQAQRVGMWFLMNGSAQCVSGVLSYGIHHITTPKIQQWQILFLFTGAVTFLLGVFWWFWFPQSSTTAWFLTPEERSMAVERIRENQTGVENKHWKKEQFHEAITDPKIWLFALFSCLDNIPNSLTNQVQTIYTELGFSTLTSTLLGIPSGVVEILTIGLGIILVGRFQNSRAWIAIAFFVPNIIGSILVITLPWSEKHSILGAIYITGVGTTGFVIALAWLQSTTAGHTKKTTASAINLAAYCLGNIIGPQVWQKKFAPRNYTPWGIVLACYTLCPCIIFLIRCLLVRENRRRDAALAKAMEEGGHHYEVVDVIHPDGTVTVEKVDTAFMDLTDGQNKEFRYCL